jgi:F-type H+-transporting ATPase subunit b
MMSATVVMSGVLASEEQAPEGIELFLPPLNEIVWSAIMFALLFFIFWRFVLPSLKQALDARTEGIEGKLEKAEADRAEAQQLLAQYREQLAMAREEAASIRAKAQSDKAAIVAEARAEAEEAARVVSEQATARLEADVARVRAALSRDVGRLATDLAARIVGDNLDRSRAAATVDAFLAELESKAPAGRAGSS